MKTKKTAIFYAILAAALYALNAPVSKLLLTQIPSTMMAGLLYLGAGIGMFFMEKLNKNKEELPLTKKELPYTIGMVVLDIAAPIFLMIGLTTCSAANASLLNNFEIVATSLIALFIFKESINKRLWAAILFVTFSSILLSLEDMSSLTVSWGSLFVLLACVCWGLENNCTRMLSSKNPAQIVIIKGLFEKITQMQELGLDVPFTARVCEALQAENVHIDCDYTVNGFVQKTLEYAQSKGAGTRLTSEKEVTDHA